MIIVNEDDAPFQIQEPPHKRTLKVLISPAMHEEVSSLAVGLTILPSSSTSNWANHEEGELFYVVFGNGKIKIENELYPLRPGTTIWVDPFQYHQLINDTENTIKLLWVLSPPGLESDFVKDFLK
jgi:mannose-6-phosphate isomerase-like protein (cupin superfamily)